MDVNVAVTRTVNGTNPRDVIIQICDVLSSVRLHGVVFGDETEREALAQILDFLSSQTLIPIIGIRGGSAVVMTKKEEESIFLQFGATVQQQSRVIMRIMEEYDWHSFSVVTSHYTGYQDFIYHLHITVESSYVGWHLDRIIPLDLLDRDSDDQIKAKLRSIQTQVVVLYCSMAEAEYLFRVAETVGLTGFGYVWIVPGLRWSESERRPPGHFPTGMVTISYDDERRGLAHRAMEGVAVVATAAFNMFVEFGFIPESKLNCNNTNAFNSTLWSTFYRCLRNITWRGRDLSFNSNGYLEKPSMTVMALNNERVWEKVRASERACVCDGTFFAPYVVNRPSSGAVVSRAAPRCATNPATRVRFPLTDNAGDDSLNRSLGLPLGRLGLKWVLNAGCVFIATGNVEIYYFSTYVTLTKDPHRMNVTFIKRGTALLLYFGTGKGGLMMSSQTTPRQQQSLDSTARWTVALLCHPAPNPPTEPYSAAVWVMMFVLCLSVVAIAVFVFEYISPKSYDRNLANGATPGGPSFTIGKCVWLLWALVFNNSVPVENPRGTSSKIMVLVWAFFAVIFLASYTANLAAFMIQEEYIDQVSGLSDKKFQKPTEQYPPLRFGTVPNGSTERNIRNNYPEMHAYMSRYNQRTVEDALLNLKASKLDAFIYDAAVLNYMAGKDEGCKLVTIGSGKVFATTGYGIALQKGSKWKRNIDLTVLQLLGDDELEELETIWLAGICKKEKNEVMSSKLDVDNMAGVFYMLLVAMGLSLLVFLAEHIFYRRVGRAGRKASINPTPRILLAISRGIYSCLYGVEVSKDKGLFALAQQESQDEHANVNRLLRAARSIVRIVNRKKRSEQRAKAAAAATGSGGGGSSRGLAVPCGTCGCCERGPLARAAHGGRRGPAAIILKKHGLSDGGRAAYSVRGPGGGPCPLHRDCRRGAPKPLPLPVPLLAPDAAGGPRSPRLVVALGPDAWPRSLGADGGCATDHDRRSHGNWETDSDNWLFITRSPRGTAAPAGTGGFGDSPSSAVGASDAADGAVPAWNCPLHGFAMPPRPPPLPAPPQPLPLDPTRGPWGPGGGGCGLPYAGESLPSRSLEELRGGLESPGDADVDLIPEKARRRPLCRRKRKSRLQGHRRRALSPPFCPAAKRASGTGCQGGGAGVGTVAVTAPYDPRDSSSFECYARPSVESYDLDDDRDADEDDEDVETFSERDSYTASESLYGLSPPAGGHWYADSERSTYCERRSDTADDALSCSPAGSGGAAGGGCGGGGDGGGGGPYCCRPSLPPCVSTLPAPVTAMQHQPPPPYATADGRSWMGYGAGFSRRRHPAEVQCRAAAVAAVTAAPWHTADQRQHRTLPRNFPAHKDKSRSMHTTLLGYESEV
ncbi:unnamed protein product [Lampetra fluviatilis]